ncbi:MAG: polyprenyl synthetase family protein [Chloroflexota bacterium]
MDDLDTVLRDYSEQLDRWLLEVIPEPIPATVRFYEMVRYHLGWIDEHGHPSSSSTALGKRIRPALALLACESLGGSIYAARGAAAAIELVHNFSLVHDDIQDHSPMRRHRPTVWHRWGAGQAINVGDHIFTLAQLALTRLSPADPALIVAALDELNRTCVLLVEGQFIDLALADATQCSQADYFAMIERKTAALIACACRLGALFAGAGAEVQDAFAAFGRELGIAYQLQDDVLGVWGTDALGKSADADILERKKAIPAVLALAQTGPDADTLRTMYASTHPLTDAEVNTIRVLLTQLNVRAGAEALAHEHYEAARAALQHTGASHEARTLIEDLCGSLLSRQS